MSDIAREAEFLIERLRSFEGDNMDEASFRDWNGHVSPSISRLEALLKAARAQKAGSGEAVVDPVITLLQRTENEDDDDPGPFMTARDWLRLRKLPAGTKLYTHSSPSVPEVCDGKEQEAFEVYASGKGYDMSQHPLHYLFINDKTNAARQAWKAAISYCHESATTPQTEGE